MKRGFVTNSSSDNFWFIVLEKNRNARDDMAYQISNKRGMWVETVKSAIKLALDNALCVPDFFLEFFDFSYVPMYGLDLEKLAEADDETVSLLIEEINKAVNHLREKYRDEEELTKVKIDIAKFKGIVTPPRRIRKPIMEYVKKTYSHLLKIAEKVDDTDLEKLISRIVALAKIGLFRIEKGALTYALISFINNIIKKDKMKITITYTQVPQGEHSWESIGSRIIEKENEHRETSYGDVVQGIQKILESKNCELILGIDADYLLIWDTWGAWYKPLLADLEDTESFAVAHYRGTWFPISELIKFLDEHGLKQRILESAKRRKQKGDTLARIVTSILKMKNYSVGDECITAYEYTDWDVTPARGWYVAEE